ncbi:QacE family quaternary ammonium compound efflux SMR transporter [Shimia litoralis]|mgnify:CR=1 FL=1|uniref:QacE family quaternary ammonium compound efflux SMR transporter n=1 Tax=Shimia litoralis TaxID=420403 RepID=A0A4U7N5R9_9RHOB|nr:SMR family transporter [Shimia litoralis]TKZ21192.1 QacE family quaternary ammonium compound efflux SMR transporter [Shimia litoralis]
MPTAYIYLIVAVFAETIGTSAMQASQQFTRLGPTLVMIAAYAVSFYLLGHTLKYLPVGITYAIWSGLGIVFIAAIGYFAFNQRLDLPAVLGMGLILVGILVIHLFSKTSTH